MSAFSAEWLALREPADRAARSLSITHTAVNALPAGIVRAIDLATGTGANVRYLVPHLPPEQDWLLVDNDERLLSELPVRLYRPGLPREVRIECRHVELSELESSSDLLNGRTLVTASALLDLVSEPWMASLATLCRRAGAIALFALTYNGRITFSPVEPADDMVRHLVNRHQQTDKGFGPAVGPAAPVQAEKHFALVGYRVTQAPSDWELDPDARDIQRALIDGWTEAAIAIEPRAAGTIREWQRRRQAHVAAGRSTVVVGHDDLAAIPGYS